MSKVELNTPWRSKEAPKNHNRNQEREGVDLVLKINPEFAKMIPPLTYSERYRLEKALS